MASAGKVGWTFSSIEVENLSLNVAVGYRKEMSTITKLNFSASLYLETFELVEGL
jgi:hypothetical protein